jgi:hypothetical protein
MPNPLEVRLRIAVLLDGLIGTYTHVNDYGQEVGTSPALSIEEPSGNSPDSTVRVAGLEVVLRPNLASPMTPMLGSTLLSHRWEILLKQWDSEADTIAATTRLVGGLPEIVEVGPRVPRSTALDTIEARTLVLEFPEIQNLRV